MGYDRTSWRIDLALPITPARPAEDEIQAETLELVRVAARVLGGAPRDQLIAGLVAARLHWHAQRRELWTVVSATRTTGVLGRTDFRHQAAAEAAAMRERAAGTMTWLVAPDPAH